jgi:hypothetical protein
VERAKNILEELESEGKTLQKALKGTNFDHKQKPSMPQLRLFAIEDE